MSADEPTIELNRIVASKARDELERRLAAHAQPPGDTVVGTPLMALLHHLRAALPVERPDVRRGDLIRLRGTKVLVERITEVGSRTTYHGGGTMVSVNEDEDYDLEILWREEAT